MKADKVLKMLGRVLREEEAAGKKKGYKTTGTSKGASNEARRWLKANQNTMPFAGNAFWSKAMALKLVEKLYAAGAQLVQVDNVKSEPWRIGGPYADALLVTVSGPGNKQAVNAVVKDYRPSDKSWTGNQLSVWWR